MNFLPISCCSTMRPVFARQTWCVSRLVVVIFALLSAWPSIAFSSEYQPPNGKLIYERQCADCHGGEGKGDDDVGTGPLEGSHALADLVRIIEETMPEDDPAACKGADAKAVATYVFEQFYAAGHESRAADARLDVSRLTVPQ